MKYLKRYNESYINDCMLNLIEDYGFDQKVSVDECSIYAIDSGDLHKDKVIITNDFIRELSTANKRLRGEGKEIFIWLAHGVVVLLPPTYTTLQDISSNISKRIIGNQRGGLSRYYSLSEMLKSNILDGLLANRYAVELFIVPISSIQENKTFNKNLEKLRIKTKFYNDIKYLMTDLSDQFGFDCYSYEKWEKEPLSMDNYLQIEYGHTDTTTYSNIDLMDDVKIEYTDEVKRMLRSLIRKCEELGIAVTFDVAVRKMSGISHTSYNGEYNTMEDLDEYAKSLNNRIEMTIWFEKDER